MTRRPTRDDVLMGAAHLWAERSTCQRRHVGVVIAYQGRILVTGYNGAPSGLPHCEHECNCNQSNPKLRLPGGLEDGDSPHEEHCDLFGPLAICRNAVHAEANAIAFAAQHGAKLDGGELYTTASPCLPCAQLIINAGIVRVKCGEHYHDNDGLRLMIQAGLQVT